MELEFFKNSLVIVNYEKLAENLSFKPTCIN